jgi:arylsulfatase A-like enzyme
MGPMSFDGRITRRQFLSQAGGAAAFAALDGCRPGSRSPSPRRSKPNLVIVYPDQMRGQALGFMGQEPVLTPVLDRFAGESAAFTEAIAAYPLCSPSRAMLLSMKYPHRNGVLGNCNSDSAPYGYELRTQEVCWSDILRASGYSLGYIGKWHLDSPRRPYVKTSNNTDEMAWNEWTPPERRHGFDFWYAYGTYDRHLRPFYWTAEASRDEGRYVDEWGPIHEAGMAARFVRNEGGRYRDPEKPFALVVAMNPPHMPYDQVPGEYLELYRETPLDSLVRRPNIPAAGTRWGDYYRAHIRGYYAMISGVDAQFGRILAALDQAGLRDDTIVVFLSDHGNCLGIHDEISKNNPYEESVRVPLLVRWPGVVRARREDLLISVPDIGPTLLELMGLGASVPKDVEGRSLADLVRGGRGSLPSSQLYLWTPNGAPGYGRRGVRTRTHTFVMSRMPDAPPEAMLFDNVRDPYQLKDLSREDPRTAERLTRDELIPWLERTGDPWLENLAPKQG